MLSALFRKDWRQLRPVRWAGILLGVMMPGLAAAGAEAGRRGWLPFTASAEWTRREIFAELSPALVMLFVWPLMGLLLTAQSLTGDQAAGTESFLLERPVSRFRVWASRVAAAASSALAVVAATGGVTLLVAFLATGSGAPDGLLRKKLIMVGLAGLAAATLAILSALPAATLTRSPVGTVLAGLLFAAIPPLSGAFLGGAFPLATLGASPLPLGLFVPWLMVIGYVLASRSGDTRGEPAGRGRRARTVRLLLATAATTTVLFFAGAALAVRWAPTGDGIVPAPRDGVAAVLANWGPADVIETATGAIVRRVPPPAYGAAWNGDGSILAVATGGSVFGALDPVWRVEFLGPDGTTIAPPVEGSADSFPVDLAWSGKRLVVLVSGPGERGATGILWCVPGGDGMGRVPTPLGGGTLRLVSGDDQGLLLLLHARFPESGDPTTIVRMRWEGATARQDWARGVPYASFLSPISRPLSPSGVYLILHVYESVENPDPDGGQPERVKRVRPVIVDLDTGTWTEFVGRTGLAAWAEGEQLVWVARGPRETAVFTGAVGGEPEFRRAWAGANVVISSSPDHSRILVCVLPRKREDPLPAYASESFGPAPWPEGSAPEVSEPEIWLFEPSRSRWERLAADGEIPENVFAARWAGPETIARTTKDGLVFESVDRSR